MKTLGPAEILKRLEFDRETVDRWRELVARMGGEAAIDAQLSPSPEAKSRKQARRSRGIAGVCEASLSAEWRPVDFFWDRVKAKHPKVQRAVVALALRRLEKGGVAEKRGDRVAGVEFRRKVVA
jgi:hypothetical protein